MSKFIFFSVNFHVKKYCFLYHEKNKKYLVLFMSKKSKRKLEQNYIHFDLFFWFFYLSFFIFIFVFLPNPCSKIFVNFSTKKYSKAESTKRHFKFKLSIKKSKFKHGHFCTQAKVENAYFIVISTRFIAICLFFKYCTQKIFVPNIH